MKKHYRHENDCLNCGAELQGRFCHNCGQENLEMKESFSHMMTHAISDYFHFDDQFFNTINPLVTKPGLLTIEYMAGRRVRYLHPVKMYIFISLVYFVLFSHSNHEAVKFDNSDKKYVATQEQLEDKAIKKIEQDSSLSGQEKKAAIVQVKSLHLDQIASAKKSVDEADKDTSVLQYTTRQQKQPAGKRDGFVIRFYQKTRLTYVEKFGKHGTEMFYEDVKHNIPKMMFVLLPLFALVLFITFRKNKKYYVEHLIFALHLHCFYFLLMSVALLLEKVIPASWESIIGLVGLAEFVFGIWYIYRSLKVVYNRSRFRTITKMIGISFTYSILIGLGIVGVTLITAALA